MNKSFLLTLCSVISMSILSNAADSTYFNKHARIDIYDNDAFSGFDILKPSFDSGYRVYFTGENHSYVASNSHLQFKMFKYLHQNADVNTLLLEYGYGLGWLINQYVQTGDTSIKTVLQKHTFNEYYELYEKLYQYNKTLPENNKIKVVGIDIERHYTTGVKALELNLPNTKAPDAIQMDIEAIKALSRYVSRDEYIEEDDEPTYYYYYNFNKYSEQETVREIIKNFNQKDSIFKKHLGDNYADFVHIIKGLEDNLKWKEYERLNMIQEYIFRETVMMREFKHTIEENPNDKFFGQFGRCHVSRVTQEEACDWYEYNSIAQRIQNSDDEQLKGKVCTIAIFYPALNSDINLSRKFDCIANYFKAADDTSVTIFNILKNEDDCANLYSKYNYVIVNNTTAEPYAGYYGEYSYPFAGDYGDLFYVNYSKYYFNFSGLNSFLSKTPNSPELEEETDAYNIGYQYLEAGFAFTLNLTSFQNSSLDLSNNSSTEFFGYSGNFLISFDAFPDADFDMMFGYGFRHGKLHLNHSPDTSMVSGGLFGEKETLRYKNPFTAFELNAMIRHKIGGKVGIGAEAGYMWDFSDKHWRLQGRRVMDAPKQKATGLYLGVSLSYNIS